jgi:DNA-binding MarR family transcriptional regulator
MTRLGQPEIEILTWLAHREHSTIAESGEACCIAFASTQGRLSILQKRNLVSGRSNEKTPPLRVYALTAEGHRKVEELARSAER